MHAVTRVSSVAPLKDTGVHQLHFDSEQEPTQVYKSCTSSAADLGALLKKKKKDV